jgi:hypothetical protein
MTANCKDDREALDRLMSVLVDDMLNAPEEELIAEILAEGRNPTEEAEAVRVAIEEAARRCGRSRLKAAKDALAVVWATPNQNVVRLDAVAARQRLAAILKQKVDSGVSLAARNQTQLSDSDVLGMLADLDALGVAPETSDSES